MKPLPEEDEALTSLLQAHVSELPDDGFSRRVLTALPHAGRPMVALFCLYLVGACAGVAFALINGATWVELSATAARISDIFASSLGTFTDPWLGLGFALGGLSLLTAFVINRRQQERP